MFDNIITDLFATDFPDWEYIDDCIIVCPCGDLIEHDGVCPEGHVSPLRELGLI